MIVRRFGWLVAALCLIAGPWALPARADIGPIALEDSTVFESFRLPNGLRVVTRNVPGCKYVDVTVAYDFGTNDDPPGKEGTGQLLAELEFYGATAETPERTREEMPDLRPAGWDLAVTPRVTRFSEVGPQGLLPGLIHQAADRMRGVLVSPAALKTAIAAVRADLDSAYRLDPGMALHNGTRVVATGGGDAVLARRAAAKSLPGVGVRDAQQQLSATFVPANAVLAVTGDLRRLPVHKVIENEFGPIPAGAPIRRTQPAKLDSATRVVARAEVTRPVGALGLIAPSLQDSSHAGFFMELALVGAHCTKRWGPPDAPLTSRFHYSIFDDPELARFYPPVGPGETDPGLIKISFINTLNDLSSQKVTPASYYALWRGLDWLLGGPIPTEIYDRILVEPGALHTLGMTTAVREMWGGEPFWSKYRERFHSAVGTPYPEWYARMLAPRYMVDLLFVPAR